MFQKLKSKAGESLVESLLGVLLACLAFVFLCSAVMVCARVNATAADQNTAFTLGQQLEGQTVDVVFSVEGDLAGAYGQTYGDRPLMASADQEYVYYE